MYTDLYKNIPEMNKLVDYLNVDKVFSTTREFVGINARYMDELLDNQVDLANFCVESGEKALEAVTDVKDYQDLVARQKELMEEYASKVTELTEKNIRLFQDTGKEFQELITKNVAALKPAEKPVKRAVQKKAA